MTELGITHERDDVGVGLADNVMIGAIQVFRDFLLGLNGPPAEACLARFFRKVYSALIILAHTENHPK